MRAFLIGPLLQFAGGLRFKWLFVATLALFLLTLVVPDPFPFADEVLFGLATLVLSQWKSRRVPPGGAEASGAAGAARPVIDLPPDQVRRGG